MPIDRRTAKPRCGPPPAAEAGWTLVVDPGCDGWRLDHFLSHRIRRLSRSRASRLRVVDLACPDDPPLKKSACVRAGQRLRADRPLPDAGAAPPESVVLFEDRDLLVLDKPSGLATHPTASRFVRTVTHWLAGRAEPVHRLDVETSGVLLTARTREAARFYKAAFATGAVEKTYHAVVCGVPERDRWRCEIPLGFAQNSAVRIKIGAGTQPAIAKLAVVERWADGALVEARPLTGRQHHRARGALRIPGPRRQALRPR